MVEFTLGKTQKGDHIMADKSNPKKNKHLTPEDRKEIEECLCKRMSFKDFAKLL